MKLAVALAIIASTLTPVMPAHGYDDVDRWHDTAIRVGWPETMWPWLACVMYRESRGDPTAYNGKDPGYGSFGLMQLNMGKGRWGTWRVYGPILGYDITTLYNPSVNLAVALDLYHRAKKARLRPWGRSCGWR